MKLRSLIPVKMKFKKWENTGRKSKC